MDAAAEKTVLPLDRMPLAILSSLMTPVQPMTMILIVLWTVLRTLLTIAPNLAEKPDCAVCMRPRTAQIAALR